MFKILIVCAANICRSPVAQIVLAHKISSLKVSINSSGLMSVSGMKPDSLMQSLAKERGYESAENFRSKILLPSLILQADLILCMETGHLKMIQSLYPTITGKIKMISHWEEKKDVDDPVGLSVDLYKKCLNDIERYCQQWADKLNELGMVV